MGMTSSRALLACLLKMLAAVIASPLSAQEALPDEILFTNVRVFDGSSNVLLAPTDVLVRGNVIAAIGEDATRSGPETAVIEGCGRRAALPARFRAPSRSGPASSPTDGPKC